MFTLYRRIERVVWLVMIGWLVKRYWPQIEQMIREMTGQEPKELAGRAQHLAADRAQNLAADVTEKGRTMAHDVREQGVSGVASNVTHLGERARQMATGAGEKAQAVVGDVKHQVGQQLGRGSEEQGAGEAGSGQDVARFASEYSQGGSSGTGTLQSEDVATETGIPTTSREDFTESQHEGIGGIPVNRDLAEQAAGGALTDRPGEMGVSRRSGEQPPDAYSFAGDMGVPIAESMMEQNQPSGEDIDSDATAAAIEASVPEDQIGPDEGEAPDQPRTTNERMSDEGYDPDVAVLDADDADEDQGPWIAESASDVDMPAASRGVRVYGEESDTYGDQLDVEGLSAETGEGFGRVEFEGDEEDSEDLLTTGGEIDLDNDEAPLTEASETQDVVSLEGLPESGETGAFGGSDTSLAGDTLGLRESEFEPVRAGQNDDVSMRIGTGGPEEEERDSDLGKRPDDVGVETDEPKGDDSTSGISGDYDKAAETQTVPAVPKDEEAATPPSQGDVRENGATAQTRAATTNGSSTASAAPSGRARNVPKGAVAAQAGGSCPADFPIKGNANSRIYHMPGESSYDSTIPEYCFATEDDARSAGFRPRKR